MIQSFKTYYEENQRISTIIEEILQEGDIITEGFLQKVKEWIISGFQTLYQYAGKSISVNLLRNMVVRKPDKKSLKEILKVYKELYNELKRFRFDWKKIITVGTDATVIATISTLLYLISPYLSATAFSFYQKLSVELAAATAFTKIKIASMLIMIFNFFTTIFRSGLSIDVPPIENPKYTIYDSPKMNLATPKDLDNYTTDITYPIGK